MQPNERYDLIMQMLYTKSQDKLPTRVTYAKEDTTVFAKVWAFCDAS